MIFHFCLNLHMASFREYNGIYSCKRRLSSLEKPLVGKFNIQLIQYLLRACLRLFKSKQTEVSCDFCEFAFLFVLAWFRVNKLSDTNTDTQALKIPLMQSQRRVPISRIKRIHSRIFSIRSGLPIQLNTGVSKDFKCMQEGRSGFSS